MTFRSGFRFVSRALLAGGISFSLGAPAALFAQGNSDGKGNKAGSGFSSLSQRLVIIPMDDEKPEKDKKPGKPARPDNPEPSAEMKSLVQDFKQAREDYLSQAKEESKVTREALREQNKEMLDQLKEQQRRLMQESRERAKELKKEMHQDFGRVIDSGIDEGRGR